MLDLLQGDLRSLLEVARIPLFGQLAAQELEIPRHGRQRGPQLMPRQCHEFVLELAQAAVRDVTDRDHPAFMAAIPHDRVAASLEPPALAIRRGEREVLAEEL